MTVLEIDRTKYFNDNSSNKDEQKNWVVVSNGINTKTLVVMVLSVSAFLVVAILFVFFFFLLLLRSYCYCRIGCYCRMDTPSSAWCVVTVSISVDGVRISGIGIIPVVARETVSIHPFDCNYLFVSLMCRTGCVLLPPPPSTVSIYPSLYCIIPDLFLTLYRIDNRDHPSRSIRLFIVSYGIFSPLFACSSCSSSSDDTPTPSLL